MKALIFVYKTAQFQNNELQPVKQFEPNKSFATTTVAIPAMTSATLNQGIYGVFSSSEKDPPVIEATAGRAGVDYDVVEAGSKDKWPVPQVTDQQLSNIKAAFPAVTDAQINTFINEGILGV